VIAREPVGRFGVAPLDRVEHRFVFPDRFSRPPGMEERRSLEAPHHVVNLQTITGRSFVAAWGACARRSGAAGELEHNSLNEMTPVTPIANPGNVVDALDARTGQLLWEYRRPMDDRRRLTAQTRSLAITHDTVILGTVDAHLVALDARRGSVRWDTNVGGSGEAGFTFIRWASWEFSGSSIGGRARSSGRPIRATKRSST
jgi:hypothetical protein